MKKKNANFSKMVMGAEVFPYHSMGIVRTGKAMLGFLYSYEVRSGQSVRPVAFFLSVYLICHSFRVYSPLCQIL